MYTIYCIFQHFQNKVAEIRGETNFGGRWVWVPMNPSPPKQNFVATPLLSPASFPPSALNFSACAALFRLPPTPFSASSPGRCSAAGPSWSPADRISSVVVLQRRPWLYGAALTSSVTLTSSRRSQDTRWADVVVAEAVSMPVLNADMKLVRNIAHT